MWLPIPQPYSNTTFRRIYDVQLEEELSFMWDFIRKHYADPFRLGVYALDCVGFVEV